MADTTSDIIIIGAGITGLNAAKQAATQGLTVTGIEGALFGGLVANVNELDGLDMPSPLSGYRMASRLRVELTRLGVANISETAQAIARRGDLLEVTTDKGSHEARAVIIASGASLRRLDIPGEEPLTNKGVSHCVDCDAPLHKGRDVAIVGGGDSALQSALVAARHCERVHLVHRRDRFRAKAHLVERIAGLSNVIVHFNTVAEAVLGDDLVTGIRLRDLGNERTEDIACTGVFAYVGLVPNVAFAPASIARDGNGALVTDASLGTAMPGVLAAGAARAGYAGMLTDAAREGQAAADHARELIAA
jgi:thioredoxin reductase (NADPH)